MADCPEKLQTRFMVDGNYKYKFNNGYIAMSDTHSACMNFVNALEKTPGIIAQYEDRTAKLKADVPDSQRTAIDPPSVEVKNSCGTFCGLQLSEGYYTRNPFISDVKLAQVSVDA